MNLILTAGKASRMGDLAPEGCKALTPFRGRPIIEWQLDVLGAATIVARPEHEHLLDKYGAVVSAPHGRGPVGSLGEALQSKVDESVTVVYADSFFTALPDGDGWCGVGEGYHGRYWDVVVDGRVAGMHLSPGYEAPVCVGLYRFPDPWRLALRCASLLSACRGEVQMAGIVNSLDLPFVEIPSWIDLGTPEALERAA